MMIDLHKICDQTKQVVTRVGAYIRQESRTLHREAFEVKSLNSLVTHVDKSAEKQLVEALRQILPHAGFITEEKTVEQIDQPLMWIIDPIDGTTNFIHQLPFYCISVALKQEDQIVLGVIFEINRKEMFSAVRGSGAFLNDQVISVSKSTHLKDAVIATGFPYEEYQWFESYIKAFEYFVKNGRGVRRFGSAALDLAYTACGRFDGYYEYGINAWDIAAGTLIVEEAGGAVHDFQGGQDFLSTQNVIAANPNIYMRISNIIKGLF